MTKTTRLFLMLILLIFAIEIGATADDNLYCKRTGRFTIENSKYNAVFYNDGTFAYLSNKSTKPDFIYSLKSVKFGSRYVSISKIPEQTKNTNSISYKYNSSIIESYSGLDNGIEQCWLIKKRPANNGGITIEGTIISPYKPTNCNGRIVFENKSGQKVLSYGKVTVVDKNGKNFHCSPVLKNQKVKITIPEEYVKSAKFPILVDPVVGSEMPIVPSFAAAPGNHTQVQIAASPTGYFAVWTDSRATNVDSNAGTDIFGCRISLTGQILDVMGIGICTASGDQMDPAVEWNGSEYLVAWTDRRTSIKQIYAARVLANGEVLDKSAIRLSSTSADQAFPRIASDGTNWEVVWQDNRSSSTDIYGCKVFANGTIGALSGLASSASNEEYPDIAWNGSSYFLVWDNSADVYGCKVSKSGIRTSMSDILLSCSSSATATASGIQRSARICSFGSSFIVAWEDYRNSNADVYGTRVTSSGTVSDIGGICICNASGDQSLPSVSYDGNYIMATWRDQNTYLVKGIRLTTSGKAADTSPFSVSSIMASKQGACIKGNQNNFLAGWNTLDSINAEAYATLISDSGKITQAGICMSTSVEDRPDYCVIDNGSEYLIVWSQQVSGIWKILGIRMSKSGTLLTDSPINLTSWQSGDQTQPSVAWNGSKYLLVWRGDETYSSTDWDIRGCLFGQSLNKISTSAISICTAQYEQKRPYVTSNGSNFLVVWNDSRNAVSPYYYSDIYGSIVNATGSVTPTSPEICTAAGNQCLPKAATNGTNYLAVWEDYRSGSYPVIRGSRITSTGTVQDTTAITFPATSYDQTTPDICYGGGNYFVAWSDNNSITGTRVSTAGSVMDTTGIIIDSGSTQKLCPGTCWDGNKYQVVWEDYRSALAGNSSIYHTTVNAGGGSVTDLKTALVSDTISRLKPHIFASSSSASGELFYSKFYNFTDILCTCSLTDQGVQNVDCIGSAKALPPGSLVQLQSKVVTYVGSGFFYIEDPNRCSGIKVLSTSSVNRNQLVDVIGTLGLSDGERFITAGAINNLGAADEELKPLAVRGDILGGSSLNQFTPGITGAYGLNNIGLLVTTWGKVVSAATGYFYIEPQTGVDVKVISNSLTQPSIGSFVTITGISTCEVISGAFGRAILPRQQSDIVIVK